MSNRVHVCSPMPNSPMPNRTIPNNPMRNSPMRNDPIPISPRRNGPMSIISTWRELKYVFVKITVYQITLEKNHSVYFQYFGTSFDLYY